MANLIRVDRNGTKYYEGYIKCDRCEGRGYYAIGVCNGQLVLSPVDNGICFKCGGAGKVISKWKEYTPEYEAKLEARREARRQKYLEEHKEEIEAQRRAEEERQAEIKRQQEEAEAQRLAEEARIKAEKALSNHIGKVGDKIDTTATYIKTAWFEIPSFKGYGTDTMYIHTFKIGNDTVVWKTTASLGRWNDKDEWESYEEGQEVHLKGTIKELNEYNDEKQTVLTRCRIK
jgi:hypothetical protein